ncbi:MAG TPA: hypothetical protein VKT29_16970 [Terriglobales bacterium]|nr:hypothetical protein [Terriglobales bacterium]
MLASIFGSSLSLGTCTAGPAPLSTNLCSVHVQIGQLLAPISFASPNQINIELPVEAPVGPTTVVVTVTNLDTGNPSSQPFPITVGQYAPGLFSISGNGAGLGMFVDAITGAPITSSAPAYPGQLLSVIATGLGPTSPSQMTGAAAPSTPPSTTTAAPTITVSIPTAPSPAPTAELTGAASPAAPRPAISANDETAPIVFSGLQPGAVGFNQVNFSVPTDLVPINYALTLSIGGVTSNSVMLPIGNSATTGKPMLNVSPSAISATGYYGLAPTSQPISITATTPATAYSVMTSGATWLTIDSTVGLTPGQVNATLNPAGLSPGTYMATITVSSPLTTPPSQVISVTLNVPSPGSIQGLSDIQVSTPSGSHLITESFMLSSTNGVPIPFQIAATGTPAPSYLSISPSSGVAPALVTATIDTSTLQGGNSYVSTITATALPNTAFTSSTQHNVTVNVQAANPVLAISPPVLQIDVQTGAIRSGDLLIQNTGGGGAQNYTVSIAQSTPGLTVTPAQGTVNSQTGSVVQVRVNASTLTPGPYFAVLNVSLGNLPPQQVPVAITVTPNTPFLRLNFDGIQFDARKGHGSPVSRTFKVFDPGGQTLTWTATIVSGSEWLQIANATGSASPGSPGEFMLSVNQSFTSTSSPGLYFAQVQISSPQASNSPALFTAVLNLSDPARIGPAPIPSPTGIVFVTKAGVNPQPQSVEIAVSSQTALPITASAEELSGSTSANWLGVTLTTPMASTPAPGMASVSVNTAGLAPGIYRGGVNFQIGSVIRTTNVSLVVLPGTITTGSRFPQPRATAPVCTPTGLVPTFTDGLVNNFSSQVAGPVPVTVTVIDNCGNLVPDPNTAGSPEAHVTIQFSAGDPSAKTMHLSDPLNALYSITWVPDQDATQTQVTVQATSGDLSGQSALITGNSTVVGQVLPANAPVLLTNGTLGLLNARAGAPLAPGTVVQIYGKNLSGAPSTLAQTTPLPTNLNGAQVMIGGIAAPLYGVAQIRTPQLPFDLIDAQIPYELSPGNQYTVLVNVNGALTVPDHISLVPATPGLLSAGDGTVVATRADGTPVTASHPALPNDVIIVFLVGMGQTAPAVPSGVAAPSSAFAHVTTAATAMLDDKSIQATAGLYPTFVGLYLTAFTVPAGTPPGSHQLVITQNGFASNAAALPVGSQ